MQNKVAAVVVTYNRREMLARCIPAILAQTAPCDLLIVDNASTDGTGDYVSHITDSRVHYRNTGANLGGAGGFNRGIRWAIEAGYAFIWVMDDDCIPKPDALEQLMHAHTLLDGDYGFLSSAVLWTDGKECKMNRQKIKKSYYTYTHLLRESLVQVEQATFVSLLFPAQVIRAVGLPISEYFIWGDDIEFTRRIAVRKGYPCFLVGKSEVIHAMKENNGSSIDTDSPERLDRYIYSFRNGFSLYRQEGVKGICFFMARLGRDAIRIIKSPAPRKLKRMRTLVAGFVKGLFFLPKIEELS